jgi:endo-1,4-beta-xylanase
MAVGDEHARECISGVLRSSYEVSGMKLIRSVLLLGLGALLAACGGGGGGDGGSLPPPAGGGGSGSLPPPASAPSLATTLAARYGVVDYPVGAAIEAGSLAGTDRAILLKHFSSITAENAMKPDTVWPNAPGSTTQPAPQANFAPGDALVDFAFANGMEVRGHTLLWHQTAPSWFFAGDQGNPVNYRALVQQRLRDYIFAVIQHWPNIHAWDVVNEVATDTANAANPYRTDSPWYLAYSVGGADGSQYVRDAFLFATQARASIGRNESNMKLMLNDYNTELPGKRANVLRIVQDVMNAGTGADIDGVGHQFHLQLNADVSQVTAALVAVEGLGGGLVNHVTELDVSIYADPGTCFSQRSIPPCMADYGASPPQSVLSDQARLYRALFNAFNRPSVTSVTTWGVADNHTWLNSFPVARTNRPLLFDTAGDPKWAFWAVVDPNIAIP